MSACGWCLSCQVAGCKIARHSDFREICSRTCGGTVSSGRDIVFTRGVVTIYWLDGFANRTAQWSSDTHGISSDPNEQPACLGEIRNCCAVAVGRGSVVHAALVADCCDLSDGANICRIEGSKTVKDCKFLDTTCFPAVCGSLSFLPSGGISRGRSRPDICGD